MPWPKRACTQGMSNKAAAVIVRVPKKSRTVRLYPKRSTLEAASSAKAPAKGNRESRKPVSCLPRPSWLRNKTKTAPSKVSCIKAVLAVSVAMLHGSRRIFSRVLTVLVISLNHYQSHVDYLPRQSLRATHAIAFHCLLSGPFGWVIGTWLSEKEKRLVSTDQAHFPASVTQNNTILLTRYSKTESKMLSREPPITINPGRYIL